MTSGTWSGWCCGSAAGRAAVRLLSIQVGRPRLVESALGGPPFRSGICKQPALGPVRLGPEGLDGDGQASRRYHGGPDKAILCYAAEHYPRWEAELAAAGQRPAVALGPGAFGENFTTEGLSEADVCLGDVYEIGPVQIVVREPRGPCSKLARRVGVSDLVERVHATGRAGWYCGVIQGGALSAGAPIRLRDRPLPAWPLLRVQRALRQRDRGEAAALLAEAGLAEALKASLSKVIRGPR